MREWNKKNRDKKKLADDKYRTKNPEKIKQIHKKWRDNNPEYKARVSEYSKKYYVDNIEHCKTVRNEYKRNNVDIVKERNRKYKDKNKDKTSLYENNRRKNDGLYRIKGSIRSLVKESIKRKGHHKNTKTESILGCSVDFFIEYLKSRFKAGMTIENHGEWHIDHIIPMSTAITEEEVLKLNYYTNLRPIWAEENLKKSREDKLMSRIKGEFR